jgi:hypothetical protein
MSPMKRAVTALFAVFVLTFGTQGAFAASNDPGDTPGKSPYHKTHGDQSDHAKPGNGGGKGLGHCKHDPGGCDSPGGGGGGGQGSGRVGSNVGVNDGTSRTGALSSTGV